MVYLFKTYLTLLSINFVDITHVRCAVRMIIFASSNTG